MSTVARQPHVTLSGDRAGKYVIYEERPDGALYPRAIEVESADTKQAVPA
jgi:hypothetical protein